MHIRVKACRSGISKPLLSAVVETPGPVWAVGVALLPEQLDDRRSLLCAVGKGLNHKALVTFLNDLDFGGVSSHS